MTTELERLAEFAQQHGRKAYYIGLSVDGGKTTWVCSVRREFESAWQTGSGGSFDAAMAKLQERFGVNAAAS